MSDLRIHAALSPRVAVLSSPDVDRVVQLNGIPDLSTLLRPFEFSVERLSVRTSQLETRICDRFPLRFDPYSLFNPEAASAISSPHSHPLPRPSAVARSNEELLDRVNHLIATNIKKWDAQVPRPVSTAKTSTTKEKKDEEEEAGDDSNEVWDDALAKLQRGSVEETAPWFAAVQQLVFGQRTIAKHESFGHPVAVLLAVSSASPDPMNDFAKLYETTTQSSPFPAHPYLNPDTLKYYVLIHDVRTSGSDLVSSKEILEQIKKTYGLHCCLLAINSASDDRVVVPAELSSLWTPYLPSLPTSPGLTSPTPDPMTSNVAAMLDEEDVKRIKGFIRELTAQSIVPFMERYVQHMGDHLANSRKGLTNRLFGASRKLFGGVASVGGSGDKSGNGTSTPGGLATSGGYDTQHEFYPYSSIEAQTRRLADFAFTIRDYKLAASMYDLGRKDFAGDKAYRYAAGATEMFGLSHLMIMYTSRSPPIDVDSYLAQACHEYGLRSPARVTTTVVDENHALRATLLYYEAYRMLGYLRPAPAGLLRMSQKSDEVLAPLLLEQAALACLQLRPRPSLRKYALYLVTAAHKYQACGQKILSLRCYAQAAVVYREKGWALIENHIEHKLGMQAYNEGDSDAAVAHLVKLIRPSANSPVEHEGFLKDVQTAYKYSDQSSTDGKAKTLALPYPIFDTAGAMLRFVPELSASATSTIDDAVWEKLEQDLVDNGLAERTMLDGSKKRRKRPTSQTSTQARQVPINQTFWLDIEVRNPLGVDLTIDTIRPVLKINSLKANDTEPTEQLSANEFDSDDAGKHTLGPFQHRRVRVAMRVRKECKSLRVASVTFRLAETIHLVQQLEKKGNRLNGNKEQRTSVAYGPDLSLAVSVHGPRPTLTARIVESPQQVFLGEQVRLQVLLKNEGSAPIDDLRALCNQPEVAIFDTDSTTPNVSGEQHTMPNHLGPVVPQSILDQEGHTELQSGQEVETTLIIRPIRTGDVSLAWLLSFSSSDGETYLSRLALCTQVSPAVQISVATKPARITACVHDVMVEARNQLSRDEVRLDALSVLSPLWRIVSDDGKDEMASVVIAPLQTWRGRLRIEAVPIDAKADEESEYTATKLQDLLLSRDVRRPRPVDVHLEFSSQVLASCSSSSSIETRSMLLSLHREARKIWRLRMLSLAFPTLSARDRSASFTLWDARDFDLLAHYTILSAGQPNRTGQTQVYGLQPGPCRSQIRAITHPHVSSSCSASKTGQIRSLYAETIKEKASLLQNILLSRLALDQCPTVVYVERVAGQEEEKEIAKKKRYTFVVRNFSDRYTAHVEIQLGDGANWTGRKTLRCTLEAGGCSQLTATRLKADDDDDDSKGVGFEVVTKWCLPDDEKEEGVLVGRFVEQH
ncbi:uncharacterized protein UTRI_04590 [Ustilago trichophora]|uniref:TPPC8 first Ig-like domain-containing protein n=1 Tax=Ustilago trichophora TaxID=86804 RepID=A0A5C3EEQ7_9BASI|nr:uncharacterized protein UTRI_04588 [Ustilago trichophora]SPO28712.1 uncharacterized protein UTRI_04590 [Ustilago trichophora]